MMKKFMDQDFLLSTDTAKTLYHDFAAKMPIIDYHCHINPEEIAADRKFETMTQVWLGGDHYKWRLMRSNGVDEFYITGDASDKEKFKKWAEVLPRAIGNPLYHWSHLELQRYFGYHGTLNADTAEEVFGYCSKKLADPSMSVRNLIKSSNVSVICTTDDPADTLEWHKAIAEDQSFDVTVLPAWRPDKAMNIEKREFTDYLQQLSLVSGIEITDFQALKDALSKRLEFFIAMGCRVTDHALDYVMYQPAQESTIHEIFNKRLSLSPLSKAEILQYKTAFMLFMGREYHRHNLTMQLHYGSKRNNNQKMFQILGPDTGYDCINNHSSSSELADFLNALNTTDQLPKTILYSLNPTDNAAIGTILGCFQDSSGIGKLQQGSAWWFNDHKPGMVDQLTSYSCTNVLGNFIGMLTDSRSFLSYTRHEYFRRILCEHIGTLVENGEYPADLPYLGSIVSDISYYNAKRYFGF